MLSSYGPAIEIKPAHGTHPNRNVRRLSVGEVRRRGVDEMADIIAVDVDGEDDVVCLRHKLLAEVGADEAAGANHADGEGRDGRRRDGN